MLAYETNYNTPFLGLDELNVIRAKPEWNNLTNWINLPFPTNPISQASTFLRGDGTWTNLTLSGSDNLLEVTDTNGTQYVVLDSLGRLGPLDGSQLTGINASGTAVTAAGFGLTAITNAGTVIVSNATPAVVFDLHGNGFGATTNDDQVVVSMTNNVAWTLVQTNLGVTIRTNDSYQMWFESSGGEGGAATNVVWPVAGANVTASTNGLEVTINANGQTNGLGTAAWSAATAFDAAGTAQDATNGLGSAAWTDSSAYDVAGTAQNATNGLGSAAWSPATAFEPDITSSTALSVKSLLLNTTDALTWNGRSKLVSDSNGSIKAYDSADSALSGFTAKDLTATNALYAQRLLTYTNAAASLDINFATPLISYSTNAAFTFGGFQNIVGGVENRAVWHVRNTDAAPIVVTIPSGAGIFCQTNQVTITNACKVVFSWSVIPGISTNCAAAHFTTF
jgi:hypothetical protein